MNARETLAIVNLRAVNQAQFSFLNGTGKYATSLSELCGIGGRIAELSGAICTGEDHGYLFTVASSSPADSYAIDARPKTPGSSGRRFFYSDQTMVVRQSENGPATANSLELR